MNSSRMYVHILRVGQLVLNVCLLQEAALQATQYIPDIVKLQKQMFDEFHHRIDHKIAHTTRMRDFIAKKHTGIDKIINIAFHS